MAQLTFDNPIALWLLLALPLFWISHFYFLRRTKRKAMRFSNFRVLKRITGHKTITRNYSVLAIRTLILIAAVLAASQATLWYEGDVNENAYVIAIDVSPSMLAQDIPPSRLEVAKEHAIDYLDAIGGSSEYGIISFSSVSTIEQTLTDDKSAARDAIRGITPSDAGGTDIPGAIITSANLLASTERGKSLVLVTDGSSTIETFRSESIQRGIEYAQEQHLMIHTIGIGTQSGPLGFLPSYYNISATYNQENLEYIANETGGEHITITEETDLLQAYQQVAQESNRALVKADLAPGMMMLILALLFLEWGLISTRFRTIP